MNSNDHFPHEELIESTLAAKARMEPANSGKEVDLTEIEPLQLVSFGFHEIYGQLSRNIGLHNVMPQSSDVDFNRLLFHVVMARLATLETERDRFSDREHELGIGLPLHEIYRMMDELGTQQIDRICDLTGEAIRALLK